MTICIRDAQPSDHAFYAMLFPELGVPDGACPKAAWVNSQMAATTVAVEDERVLGYLYAQRLPTVGYIRNIVVDAGARRRGIASTLMRRLGASLATSGVHRWALNVMPDNVSAIRLYESLGLQREYDSFSVRADWQVRTKLNRSPDCSAEEIAEGMDADYERIFEMFTGQLAHARLMPGVALIGITAQDGPVAVASFSPDFPGAFPFRTTHPHYLRALMDAVFEHRNPDRGPPLFTIENDAVLFDTLIAAGGTLELSAVHMRGDIAPPPL